MPPASRGRTAPPRPSGAGGFLPRFVAGAGRLNRRGEPGRAGSGGWGRLALAGLVLVLVVAFATRPLGRQPDAGSIGFTKPKLDHPTMPVRDGGSRFSQHGLLGNRNNIETETASGGGSADGGDALSGEGGSADGSKEGSDNDGADDAWGSDGAGLGPGAPGFPLGEDDIHVVFSSDCTNYQAWQAVVLFHSAILSGHTGPITQLISGCSDEEQAEAESRHEVVRHSPKHKLFFTPGFVTKNPETGEPYPYMNKPNAMQIWLDQTEVEETIVALIDPDFIFLKPLTTWLSPTETVVKGDGLSLEGLKLENGGWVRKGYPAGQRFGLPNWTHWDLSNICPDDALCATTSTTAAKRYYDLIPPYLAHQDDWRRLLPEWVAQAPKVYEMYPSLLAEQTAYATAAATLDMKHYRINNYAIENEKVDYELWDPVDHQMDNVCDIGIEPRDIKSRNVRSFDRLPNFIHYCHMYRVGQWLFNKRRYRKESDYDQLQCDTPMLETPPMNIQESTYKMHPGARYESITPRSAKRNAFVLCMATRFVNSALRHFKGRMCAEGFPNLDYTVRIA
ncbi:conserved unknown protein [Ectocarpus siliculosus]|uniref:Uncharacterized protein n=1 Tax=Ectocarpus siliculosus TaxID=2880 RepID=D7G4L7_ECTSI|nr:conserved unknown protein [Ectocarpus siliculosus]|eukprot:CBJ48920.1 conserved unknown protein [Ectocarpus siliculosus]